MRKRPKKYLKNLFKHAGMGAIILTAFYLTGFWVTQFAYDSQAAQEKINVNFAPSSNEGNPYKLGEVKTVNLILKPKNPEKEISGFTIKVSKEGVLDIVGVREPSVYPNLGGEQDIVFTPVEVRPHTVTYVLTLTNNKKLPRAVKIPVEIRAGKKGEGKLKLNQNSSSVVGNIAGSEYEFGKVDEGVYKFK